jgi:hypothetical protein
VPIGLDEFRPEAALEDMSFIAVTPVVPLAVATVEPVLFVQSSGSTPVCCDTTARKANACDFRVLFLGDGTETTGSEAAQMQKATLGVLDGLFAQVLTVDEMPQKSGIIGVLIVSTLISN